jgi:uncharacterized membrane protein
MSFEFFESGRKLGLAASLIAVLAPIITVIAFILFYVLTFFSLIATSNPSPPSFASSMPILFGAIGITSIAGVILFVVAMHRLAQYYNEQIIFKNTLYGFIINLVGGLCAFVAVSILMGYFVNSFTQGITQTAAASPTPSFPPIVPPSIATSIVLFLAILITAIAVVIVIGLIAGVLYIRAFNKLGEKSGIYNFNTAGILILIGVIIPVISWIGWIFAALGFHSLKPRPAESSAIPYSATPQPSYAQSSVQKKYCPYCVSENNANAIYCSQCVNNSNKAKNCQNN